MRKETREKLERMKSLIDPNKTIIVKQKCWACGEPVFIAVSKDHTPEEIERIKNEVVLCDRCGMFFHIDPDDIGNEEKIFKKRTQYEDRLVQAAYDLGRKLAHS